MLEDGKGGMGDYGLYRQRLTDIMFHGKMPDLSPEEQAAQAEQATGGPPPESALDEARVLFEQAKARQAQTIAAEETPDK